MALHGGFEIDSEVLRRHSARVDQVAGDIRTAQQAAGTTDLNGGAFGILCGFLPGIVSGNDTAARDAIAAVHEAAEQTVTGLRAMAAAYDDTDQRVEERMRRIARVLDR
jgi:type II secretory pathway component PulM